MLQRLVELLILSNLNAFLIIGFYYSCEFRRHPKGNINSDGADGNGIMNDSKMVLWRLRFHVERSFGDFWSKPICTCVQCMASLHSVIPYTIYCLSTDARLLFLFPFYVCTVSAMAKLINSKIYT